LETSLSGQLTALVLKNKVKTNKKEQNTQKNHKTNKLALGKKTCKNAQRTQNFKPKPAEPSTPVRTARMCACVLLNVYNTQYSAE